jgi:hypothetical protein
MDFVHIRGPAEYLLEVVRHFGPLVLLRLDGDPDDHRFWHAVVGAVDDFRDRGNEMVRVTFDDGAPTKVFLVRDVVEFAVPRLQSS